MFKSLSLVSLGGCCQKVEVTHSSNHLKSIYEFIYGTYTLSGIINEHNYYVSDGFNGSHAIWWCNYGDWVIDHVSNLGQCNNPYAYPKTNKCVDTFGYDWGWCFRVKHQDLSCVLVAVKLLYKQMMMK